jgi:hypothetical protein
MRVRACQRVLARVADKRRSALGTTPLLVRQGVGGRGTSSWTEVRARAEQERGSG